MGPNPYLWFLHAKQRLLEQNYKYLCITALICGFCIQNSAFWTRISSLYGSQTSSVVLSTHNCVLNTRIKRLYVFQPSPLVLCMQNSEFSTWIASLYGSQPSSVFFAFKTVPFGPEQQISMGPRHHLSFCACNTAWLAPVFLFSIVPNPYLWFLDAQQRLLDQNNKSLRVPDKSCRFVLGKQQL